LCCHRGFDLPPCNLLSKYLLAHPLVLACGPIAQTFQEVIKSLRQPTAAARFTCRVGSSAQNFSSKLPWFQLQFPLPLLSLRMALVPYSLPSIPEHTRSRAVRLGPCTDVPSPLIPTSRKSWGRSAVWGMYRCSKSTSGPWRDSRL
jgi:hypothetical protein